MISEENWLAEKLRPHIGHNLVCVRYGSADAPADICVECEDCREVLVSAEDYNKPNVAAHVRAVLKNMTRRLKTYFTRRAS